MALSIDTARFEIHDFSEGSRWVIVTLFFSEDAQKDDQSARHPCVKLDVSVSLKDDATVEAVKAAALSEAKRLAAAAMTVLESADPSQLSRITEAWLGH